MKLPIANNATPGTFPRQPSLTKIINTVADLFYEPQIQVNHRARTVRILDGPGARSTFLTPILALATYSWRGYSLHYESSEYHRDTDGHIRRINDTPTE